MFVYDFHEIIPMNTTDGWPIQLINTINVISHLQLQWQQFINIQFLVSLTTHRFLWGEKVQREKFPLNLFGSIKIILACRILALLYYRTQSQIAMLKCSVLQLKRKIWKRLMQFDKPIKILVGFGGGITFTILLEYGNQLIIEGRIICIS